MRIASMQVQHVAAARAKPPTETSCHRKPDAERLGTSYPRFALFVERSRGGREGAKQGTLGTQITCTKD